MLVNSKCVWKELKLHTRNNTQSELSNRVNHNPSDTKSLAEDDQRPGTVLVMNLPNDPRRMSVPYIIER